VNIAQTHTLQFWRATESRGPYGTVERTWTAFGSPVRGDVQHRTQSQADIGPGVSSVGTWKVYTKPMATEPEMVVQVIEGPNANQTLRIDDAYHIRGVLTQLTCAKWEGDLDG
jgi:hypothetical protein